MKACFVGVSETFHSYAGEDTRVMELANNLLELGVEVHIVVPRTKSLQATKSTDSRCKATMYETAVRFSIPKFHCVSTLISQMRSLAKLKKRECLDVIHTDMFWGGLKV